MLPVLGLSWVVLTLAALFLTICLVLVLVILVQKPRGGGLSGAFGGGGGSAQSAFGSKTGDFLTVFTVSMFVCFILLAMGMQWAINADRSTRLDEADQRAPVSPAGGGAVAPAETPQTPVAVPEAAPATPPVDSADSAPATDGEGG